MLSLIVAHVRLGFVDVPEVRFANSDSARVAYQAYGDGPALVAVPPLVSNLEIAWEHELYRRAFERFARHVRVVIFDKRGTGLSDRYEKYPTVEQRIGDIAAVMDAEGIQRASLLGLSEGGLISQLFAGACPERVDRLVLLNSCMPEKDVETREIYAQSYFGSEEALLAGLEGLVESWGVDPGYLVDLFCPCQKDNPAFVRWAGRYARLGCTSADLGRHLESINLLCAEHGIETLERIQAPTLVIQVSCDRVVPPGFARFMAEHIRGARYLEVAGDDHFCWVMPNWREVVDPIIEFVTDRPVARTEVTRRFAVVMFTDIVDSTTSAARVGDATWRETLDSHDRIAWRAANDHGGRIVKSTGDGVLAIFESPSAAVACATELRAELAAIGLDIRAGLHAGEIEVRDETDISGLAVHIAARVEHAADSGQILVSPTLRDLLLGTELQVRDTGERRLKGLDGAWRLFELC
jgi:class 3 adenylate cyclase